MVYRHSHTATTQAIAEKMLPHPLPDGTVMLGREEIHNFSASEDRKALDVMIEKDHWRVMEAEAGMASGLATTRMNTCGRSASRSGSVARVECHRGAKVCIYMIHS